MNVVSRVTKVTHLQEYRVEPQAAIVTQAAATVLAVTQATGVTARYIYQHKQQNIVNLQTVPLYNIGTYYSCDVLTIISSTTVYLTSVIDTDPQRPSTIPKHYYHESPFLQFVLNDCCVG